MPGARETRAIGNRESCYQEWKLENSSAFWLEFERLTLNNLREDSNVQKPSLGRVSPSAPNSLQQSKQNFARVDARDGVKFVAEDSTWLMLRGSGTEPVLRIYAEAKSDAGVQKLLKLGVSLLRD